MQRNPKSNFANAEVDIQFGEIVRNCVNIIDGAFFLAGDWGYCPGPSSKTYLSFKKLKNISFTARLPPDEEAFALKACGNTHQIQ